MGVESFLYVNDLKQQVRKCRKGHDTTSRHPKPTKTITVLILLIWNRFQRMRTKRAAGSFRYSTDCGHAL